MMPFTPCADAERAVFTPEELERIEYMRAGGILLDPDGYDSIEEIRAALDVTAVFRCIECGKLHSGSTRLCTRCYVENKT